MVSVGSGCTEPAGPRYLRLPRTKEIFRELTVLDRCVQADALPVHLERHPPRWAVGSLINPHLRLVLSFSNFGCGKQGPTRRILLRRLPSRDTADCSCAGMLDSLKSRSGWRRWYNLTGKWWMGVREIA